MAHSRPSRSRALLAALTAALHALTAVAGTIEFTQDGLNARTSLNFVGQANVLTTVPKDTQGEVLDRYTLPSGNTGVKIKITKLGPGPTRLAIDQEIWVYYHRDPGLRRVALYDDDGKKVDQADQGKWAIALSTFRVKTSPKKVAAGKKKEDGICTECSALQADQNALLPVIPAQTTNLENVVQTVNDSKEQANDPGGVSAPPTLDLATEETTDYIAKAEKNEGTTVNPATNLEIAKTLVADAPKYGVTVSLALAVIEQESEFKPTANSKIYVTDKVTHQRRRKLNTWGKPVEGAIGLMQIMPESIFAKFGFSDDQIAGWSESEYYTQIARAKKYGNDPKNSIELGLAELGGYLKKYHGDQEAALASYNMGPNGYEKYLAGKESEPSETRKYVPAVLKDENAYLAYEKTSGNSLMLAEND